MVRLTAGGDNAASEVEAQLALPGAPGGFTDAELDGLPEPVRRYFRTAMAPGAPLAQAARVEMRGRLRFGNRWIPFRAREVLAPHRGFVWTARVAGVITGSDRYLRGRGGLDWRFLGVVSVMRASGPDVDRSAAARGGGEAAWVPSALLPRWGVAWSAADDAHLSARYCVDDVELAVRYRTNGGGRIRSLTFDRWGDPDETGAWGLHPFGIDVTGYGTHAGLTVPTSGRAGWFHGTDRWPDGEFFRYRITRLDPIPARPNRMERTATG